MMVLGSFEPGIAHFHRVTPRNFEAMFKTDVEVKPWIIVALSDAAAGRIADRQQRVGILAEAIRNDFETDPLTRFYIDRIAIDSSFKEGAPHRRGQRSFERRRTNRQIIHHEKASVGQAVLRGESDTADANGRRGAGRDVHDDAVRAALDWHGFEGARRQRVPQIECGSEIGSDETDPRRLAALDHWRRDALDAV